MLRASSLGYAREGGVGTEVRNVGKTRQDSPTFGVGEIARNVRRFRPRRDPLFDSFNGMRPAFVRNKWDAARLSRQDSTFSLPRTSPETSPGTWKGNVSRTSPGRLPDVSRDVSRTSPGTSRLWKTYNCRRFCLADRKIREFRIFRIIRIIWIIWMFRIFRIF